LSDEYIKVCKARELLNLGASDTEKLQPFEEDVAGLKEVWAELNGVWSIVDDLREVPWSAIVPKKIREALDSVLEGLQKFPSRLRQYEAYESMKNQVQKLKKTNILIVELKSESLKERHWKTIMQKIKLRRSNLNDVNLGMLWDADLMRH